MSQKTPTADCRIQLHLVLPYKLDPVDDPRILKYLRRGYRVEQLQRLTDREVIVTLAPDDQDAASPAS